MIQKHCFECGTALIEKELEEEGIVPYCPKMPAISVPDVQCGSQHDCCG